MGILVRLIGSGIGLASEAIAARKSSSQVPTQASLASSSSSNPTPPISPDEAPPKYVEVPDARAEELIASGKAVRADSEKGNAEAHQESDSSSEDDIDEEQWQLDEAISPTRSEGAEEEKDLTEAQVTDAFMRNHPPPAYAESSRKGKLPCPVIIPQRRPKDKKRGFIRAYAPVLADCGIDQAAFLDFLKSFHSASKASPWFQVVNIAAAGVGMVPNPIAMGVSMAVQFAVGVAMEIQSRTRSNSFLDRINKEFFQPRGLFCLVMTFKPDSTKSHERVDIMQTVQKSLNPTQTGMRAQFSKLAVSSGKTYGELEMPEAAPLIFPGLEKLAADNSAEAVQKKNSLKSSQKFLADYFDRKAQAKWAAENPGSTLASAPSSKFASRFSDPNHPAVNGSLVSLITGGHVNPKARKEERRVRRAERRGREVRPRRKREGAVKRILKKDVLYLMVVNLPSEEELAQGRRAVAAEENLR